MAVCCYCNKEFNGEANKDSRWQEYEHYRYCSEWCRQSAKKAYDRYVDPIGFYQSKAGDPYE